MTVFISISSVVRIQMIDVFSQINNMIFFQCTDNRQVMSLGESFSRVNLVLSSFFI
jgi:hypothetical protein